MIETASYFELGELLAIGERATLCMEELEFTNSEIGIVLAQTDGLYPAITQLLSDHHPCFHFPSKLRGQQRRPWQAWIISSSDAGCASPGLLLGSRGEPSIEHGANPVHCVGAEASKEQADQSAPCHGDFNPLFVPEAKPEQPLDH